MKDVQNRVEKLIEGKDYRYVFIPGYAGTTAAIPHKDIYSYDELSIVITSGVDLATVSWKSVEVGTVSSEWFLGYLKELEECKERIVREEFFNL